MSCLYDLSEIKRFVVVKKSSIAVAGTSLLLLLFCLDHIQYTAVLVLLTNFTRITLIF